MPDARRTLRGIDEQVKKAEQAVAGKVPVKRNRFIQLSGGTRPVNRELEDKARALAGIKGYVTNLAACPDGTPVTAEFVIGAYHQLFQIEKSFRMAKSDVQARPTYHRTRDSIEAHLTIVFAALAVSRWIENQTGWTIRKFVKTARRYRTIQIQAGNHVITAADPSPTTSARTFANAHHQRQMSGASFMLKQGQRLGLQLQQLVKTRGSIKDRNLTSCTVFIPLAQYQPDGDAWCRAASW